MDNLKEVTLYFLRLGVLAFGGPAAHIAMMHDELVRRRQWVTDEEFLDLMAVTQIIPGPNSTEMAMQMGFRRAGWRGWLVSGFCFLIPAVCLVMICAWIYTTWGGVPMFDAIMHGVKPAVLAIVAITCWRLGKKQIKKGWHALFALGCCTAYLMGVHEVLILFAGGSIFYAVSQFNKAKGFTLPFMPSLLAVGAVSAEAIHSVKIFAVFLKAGALLYGSGYVLFAFLENDLVNRLGWLSQSQLMDAIAIGQITPGPVLTTATFVGYLLDGVPGGLVATAGIFLPSFIFVGFCHNWAVRLRASPQASKFLSGLVFASLGLMLGVVAEWVGLIAKRPEGVLIALVALGLMAWKNIAALWVMLGSAVIGLLWYFVTG